MDSSKRDGPYPYKTLLDFAETLLLSAGLEKSRARVIAEILLGGGT